MKKFLLKISYTIFPLWLIFIGSVLYVNLYITPRASGDIGRLAFIPFGYEYNQILKKEMIKDTLFQTIYTPYALKNIHVDVFNIGDSFSQKETQLGTGGYPNYLGKKGLKVVNYNWSLCESPMEFAFYLLEENFVDSTNTQFLVVETVERCFEERCEFSFEKENVFSGEIPIIKMKPYEKWSVARIRDFVLFKMGLEVPIYHTKLDKDFFSSDDPNALYFYFNDIELGTTINKNSEEKIKQVFEKLKLKAEEKGITLILLVAVDKYDLYQDHIVNNPWPQKTINEDIERIIGKSPNLLLSKYYITPLVEKGEKDVFMFNDTHWSYKASKVVADELYNRIEYFRSIKK